MYLYPYPDHAYKVASSKKARTIMGIVLQSTAYFPNPSKSHSHQWRKNPSPTIIPTFWIVVGMFNCRIQKLNNNRARNELVKPSTREPYLSSYVWYSFSLGPWNLLFMGGWELEQLARSNHGDWGGWVNSTLGPFIVFRTYLNRMVSCSSIDWLLLTES